MARSADLASITAIGDAAAKAIAATPGAAAQADADYAASLRSASPLATVFALRNPDHLRRWD